MHPPGTVNPFSSSEAMTWPLPAVPFNARTHDFFHPRLSYWDEKSAPLLNKQIVFPHELLSLPVPLYSRPPHLFNDNVRPPSPRANFSPTFRREELLPDFSWSFLVISEYPFRSPITSSSFQLAPIFDH